MEEMSSVLRSQGELSGFDRGMGKINGSEFAICSGRVHARGAWFLREGEERSPPHCTDDICLKEAMLGLVWFLFPSCD